MLGEQQLILAKIQRMRVILTIFLLNLSKIKLIFALFQLKLAKSYRIRAKLIFKFSKKKVNQCECPVSASLCPYPLFCPVYHWLQKLDKKVSGPLQFFYSILRCSHPPDEDRSQGQNPWPSANLSLIVIKSALFGSSRAQLL